MVDQFNNSPSTFVFLISSLAGGVGLNLTGAREGAMCRSRVPLHPEVRPWLGNPPVNSPSSERQAAACIARHANPSSQLAQSYCSASAAACCPCYSLPQPPTRSSSSTPRGTRLWTCVRWLLDFRPVASLPACRLLLGVVRGSMGAALCL